MKLFKFKKPIPLEEMSGIKLMNRTDTKFVATTEQLYAFLTAVATVSNTLFSMSIICVSYLKTLYAISRVLSIMAFHAIYIPGE